MADAPSPLLTIIAAETEEAKSAKRNLIEKYGNAPLEKAAAVVALGGDGFLLETLHQALPYKTPVYGMNRGSVGFLLNNYHEDLLPERIAKAQRVTLYPLRMRAETRDGKIKEALAFNEVSLLRETRQAAKLRIKIDGIERMAELICDGALVCTPAGSTAYNLSAHGPIIPLQTNVLALTPISAFRPRRWRGALLPHTAEIVFEILEDEKRPVSAVADFTEVRDVKSVTITEDRSIGLTLLFDPEMNLEERILKEQFSA